MRRSHRGFTLVELLVVIAIIGMLAGLILPAVGRAREAARAAQCANNLKQFADAMLHYESTKNQIPGFVADINTSANNGTKTTVNWAVLLLPFMARNDIYTGIQGNAMVTPLPRIDTFVCPSAAPAVSPVPAGSTPLNYAANAGREDNISLGFSGFPFDYQQNGVFFNQGSAAKSINSSVPVATISYINKWDGATNTIAFSENLDSTTWWQSPAGLPAGSIAFNSATTVGGLGYAQGAEWQSGILWFGGMDSTFTAPVVWHSTSGNWEPAVQLNKNAGLGGTSTNANARPSSSHIAGFNMAFCDGHVGFISENIQYRVYTLLMTPRGNAAQDTIPPNNTATTTNYTFADFDPPTATSGTYMYSSGGWLSGVPTSQAPPGMPPTLTPLSQTDLTP